MATFAVWEVHVEFLKCYAVLDLEHNPVRVTVHVYIFRAILSDLSGLIIKPKYGKRKLVRVGGYVVLTESVVKVRGITWNIGQPIYTVYYKMSQPTYLLTKKKSVLCVCLNF